MPQEILKFPPAYSIIGAYRLLNDHVVWKPMWDSCSKGLKQSSLVAGVWFAMTFHIQKFFVGKFMRGSAAVTGMRALYSTVSTTADRVDDDLPFRIPLPSLTTFAAFMFVLSQCSSIIEFWLRRRLRTCRNEAYVHTVKSRGKGSDWWTLYYEEWEEPPYEKAKKNTKKQPLYLRLGAPLIRKVVLRFLLLPLDFIPFFSLFVSAYLRSLSLGRQLHTPLFAAKRMTPAQIELWMTERQFEYRTFGFFAALLESIPLLGLFFSISNRVGAAMYSHDLEKRQQDYHSGKLKPLKRDETYSLHDFRKPSSPKSSQMGKLPFAPQGEEDFKIPGAAFSSKSTGVGVGGSSSGVENRIGATDGEDHISMEERRQQRLRLEEQARRMGEDVDAPPAYTEASASAAVGGEEDNVAPTSIRRVPPPPPPRR